MTYYQNHEHDLKALPLSSSTAANIVDPYDRSTPPFPPNWFFDDEGRVESPVYEREQQAATSSCPPARAASAATPNAKANQEQNPRSRSKELLLQFGPGYNSSPSSVGGMSVRDTFSPLRDGGYSFQREQCPVSVVRREEHLKRRAGVEHDLENTSSPCSDPTRVDAVVGTGTSFAPAQRVTEPVAPGGEGRGGGPQVVMSGVAAGGVQLTPGGTPTEMSRQVTKSSSFPGAAFEKIPTARTLLQEEDGSSGDLLSVLSSSSSSGDENDSDSKERRQHGHRHKKTVGHPAVVHSMPLLSGFFVAPSHGCSSTSPASAAQGQDQHQRCVNPNQAAPCRLASDPVYVQKTFAPRLGYARSSTSMKSFLNRYRGRRREEDDEEEEEEHRPPPPRRRAGAGNFLHATQSVPLAMNLQHHVIYSDEEGQDDRMMNSKKKRRRGGEETDGRQIEDEKKLSLKNSNNIMVTAPASSSHHLLKPVSSFTQNTSDEEALRNLLQFSVPYQCEQEHPAAAVK
eukprot:CAMPEP_0178995672 /NCGR_PEP_ID=MMETSP0795-20121207/7945_1 /TAXON_ID=88552 /ORGANISM="Amoebophrya sp., Strain Ameob2" /LENGTH=511 /DNA_ID=CAMNT_0020687981 /DNA_START=126 /DNA_END=1662 /DNA_ORIENTATION=-